MKIEFNVDSGANINSCRTVIFDLITEKGQKQLGYTKDEWLALTEEEKYQVCEEWANQHIEIYFREI